MGYKILDSITIFARWENFDWDVHICVYVNVQLFMYMCASIKFDIHVAANIEIGKIIPQLHS